MGGGYEWGGWWFYTTVRESCGQDNWYPPLDMFKACAIYCLAWEGMCSVFNVTLVSIYEKGV